MRTRRLIKYILGIILAAALFIMWGVWGGMDTGTISSKAGIIASCVCLALMGGAVIGINWLEAY